AEGRCARALVEEARESVAELAGVQPAQVVFTSGATEANCWVLRAGWDVILVSGIEHDSVLAPARGARYGVVDIAADGEGRVDLSAIAAALARAQRREGKALLVVQAANNETGVVQPVAAAAKL